MLKVFVLHIKPIAHFLFSCFLLCHVGCCTKISWYATILLKKNRFVEKCTTSLDYWSPLNRHPPLMEMFIIIAPPPPTLSPSSLSFIRSVSLSSWSGIWSSKMDQWWFKLWKLIKEQNLEHLKSPCSVYFIW